MSGVPVRRGLRRPGTVPAVGAGVLVRLQKIGSLLCAVALAVIVVAGCDSPEESKIGACAIRPGALCEGNYMHRAKLAQSNLYDADLDHADLTGAVLTSSDLSGATMRAAGLAGADLDSVSFSYADLQGANFSKAEVDQVDFTGADLTGAVITPAQLARAKLCRTTMPDGTVANPNC